MQLLLVMLGGALGAGARFLVGSAALRWLSPGFPWGTLIVNVVGGMAMGVLAGWLLRSGMDSARLFLGVGVLGGFTTFSAFSLELFQMVESGRALLGAGYALASVFGATAALALGMALTG